MEKTDEKCGVNDLVQRDQVSVEMMRVWHPVEGDQVGLMKTRNANCCYVSSLKAP